MSPPATVVCALGMHRSGTSVVSRMLNLLGVHLGPHEAISHAGEDNPKGYWEHHPIVLINDEILARFGGQWDHPPVFPPGWTSDPAVDDLKDRARELLDLDFSGEPLWGWKDPRTCLTLPFWQELLGPIRYVMCMRNPSAVMASLGRRNGMEPQEAERLWLAHVQAGLAHTSGQPRMFVFYDDVMHDWPAELRRMAAFIGRPDRAEHPEVLAQAGAFLEDELRHHHPSMEELAGDTGISLAAKSLYLALEGHAPAETRFDAAGSGEGGEAAIHRTLDLLGAQALDLWDQVAALNAERDTLAHENQAHVATIAELNGTIARLTGAVATLDGSVGRLTTETRLEAESSDLAATAQTLSAQCHHPSMSVCLCTLAIHAPYRTRARVLVSDPAPAPWVVLTDEPDDFSDLPVRAIRHVPTGPMAIDYLRRIGPTGNNRGAAAYHDKRFVLKAALQNFDTAVFFDADSRIQGLPLPAAFPPGLAVTPFVRRSIAEHLETCGSWRVPMFEALARELTGGTDILRVAAWCHETCYAVTRDGHEHRFFEAWERGAEAMQQQGVFSGEGGVMGLAAAYAGWTTDYDVLEPLTAFILHEGGGPKAE